MVTELNAQNFEAEVVNSSTPVIVDFWAPWCGPCKMMGPVFEKLSHEFEGKLKFAKLNVDENQQLASQFGIQGIPALSILHNKKELDRIVGFAPEEQLREKIEQALQKL